MTETITHQIKPVQDLLETIRQLRAPGGCPWDQEQTHQSLRAHLLEETVEVLDVLDSIKGRLHTSQAESLEEELGDLLLQIVLHCQIADENKQFNFESVAAKLNQKLIRRHPHVFEQLSATTAHEAQTHWNMVKAKEKEQDPIKAHSVLDHLPKALPALERSRNLIKKVSKVGFQWPDQQGPRLKVQEEWQELEAEIQKTKPNLQRIEAELGDLLFSVVNLSYFLKLRPEEALRSCNQRFEQRFRYVETGLKLLNLEPSTKVMPQMNSLWEEAKALEKSHIFALSGALASGKSLVLDMIKNESKNDPSLSQFGYLNADLIAAEIREHDPETKDQILKIFGTLDKERIRQKIVLDEEARLSLENLLHPKIASRARTLLSNLASTHPIIIYEIPLLPQETDSLSLFSGIIYIQSEAEQQLERLVKNRKMDESEAKLWIKLHQKRKIPEDCFKVYNKGSLNELKEEVKATLKWILDKSNNNE